MSSFILLLRESLPEVIGGLSVAALLTGLGLLYRRWSRRRVINFKAKSVLCTLIH